MASLPFSLLNELEKTDPGSLPPVHLWHPEAVKEIDLIIRRDGTWVHEGSPVTRPRLVRLFASVLRREGDVYSLVTPVEQCIIKVEDVPFQIVLADVSGTGPEQVITFTTNTGEQFVVDELHPLRIAQLSSQHGEEWIPYCLVRGGMEGKLERSVYYQLSDLLARGEHPATGETWLGIYSSGVFFPFMNA